MTIMIRSGSPGRPTCVPLSQSEATSRQRSPSGLSRIWHVRAARGRRVCTLSALLLLIAPWWVSQARAQSQTPALVNMVNTLSANGVFQFDPLERAAAAANDNAYAKLLPICGQQ